MTRSVAPTGSRTPEFRTLAERLSWARETAPLTQDELAAHLGISTRTVQNYESGETRPPLNRLLLWANACDADYDWLAGDAYEAGPDPHTRAQSGERASTATVRPIRRRKRDDRTGDTHQYMSQRDYVLSQNVTDESRYARVA